MELNTDAWERWMQYRKLIHKAIKMEEPAKLKLMRMGDKAVQLAAVDQSIENGWTGLFDVAPHKANPHDPKKRTSAQEEASAREWESLQKQSQREWEKIPDSPIKRLHLAAAYLARLDTDPDQASLYLAEKRSALKDIVASLLREAEARLVLNDLNLIRLVFGCGFKAFGVSGTAKAGGRMTDVTFRGYHAIAEVLERVKPLCAWHASNRPDIRAVRLIPKDFDLIRRWPKAAELHGLTVTDEAVKLRLNDRDFELFRHVGRGRYEP